MSNSTVGRFDLKIGDKVKVVNNTSGHNSLLGTESTITQVYTNGVYRILGSTYNFYPSDLDFIGGFNREAIKSRLESLDRDRADLGARLEYLDTIGKDESNENEYKVFAALGVIEDPTLSRLDRARAIAALIAG